MYPLLTDTQIYAILPNAERVIITGEANHKEIGIRIGLFSKTASINDNYPVPTQERMIRDTARELGMMNQKQKWQVEEARKQATRDATSH